MTAHHSPTPRPHSGPRHHPHPGTPATAPELRLWHLALGQVAAGAVPGLTAISERIGPCPRRGDLSLAYNLVTRPGAHGGPVATTTDLATPPATALADPLVRLAHGFLDTVKLALQRADPLGGAAPGPVRRSVQRAINGRECVGFQATRRTAALDLEFAIWIDAHRSAPLRVDFRGLNLRDATVGTRIASLFGTRQYETAGDGRCRLVGQTSRLTFVADAPGLPVTGYAERSSCFSGHWDPPPAATPPTP